MQPKKQNATNGISNNQSSEGLFAKLDPQCIHASPFQHRTNFDPVEMEELQKDIAKNGIHTALIVREHTGAEGGFELATGERRLRIACALNLPEVPVFIRELTDRQVRELQWSENFRRVNPNPLDEAGSLSQLLQYHKTPDALARHIGKPKAYVLTRLRLLELIAEIREMVHAGVFNFQDSLDLTTLPQDTQKSFYTEYCAEWKNRKAFRIANLSAVLSTFRCDLSEAIFDPKDKDLVPEAGACTHCPYNSATFHSLFPETERKSICNRQVCFQQKCTAHLRRQLSAVMAEFKPSALVSDGSISKTWLSLLKDIPEVAALPRFSYYDIYTVEAPTEPDRADFENDEDEGGFEEADYSEAMDEYKEEKEEFEQALVNGKLRRGLYLQDGSVECILLDSERQRHHNEAAPTAAAVQQAIKAGTATPDLLQGEMTRIAQREKRSKELDCEKVQKTVHDLFTERLKDKDAIPEPTAQDQLGIRLLIYEALNYSARPGFHELVPYKKDGADGKRQPLIEWLARLTDLQVAFMTRLAIRCHREAANPITDAGQALLIMAEGIGVDVAGTQAAQAKVAEARGARGVARIAALQQRVDTLQTKESNTDNSSVAA